MFDRYGRVTAPDYKYTGEEPKWTGAESWTAEKFMRERARMFNFYNYYCSSKDLFDDLLLWMKKNTYTKDQIKQVKGEGERCVGFAYLKIARSLNGGMPATHEGAMAYNESKPGISVAEAHDDYQYLKTAVDRVLTRTAVKIAAEAKAKEEEGDDVKTLSPLERLSNKINATVITELEIMIDENGWTESQTKVDPINLIGILKANSIPAKGLKEVYDWLKRYEVSLQAALDKDNEFDIEGWAFTSKPGIKNRLKGIKDMTSQLDRFGASNKKVRAPRKKKAKAASMQIAKLQFKQSDDDYGVQSVSPLNVPGANRVIVFNTKYRKLGVYFADSPIEVKGTALKNWDEEKSFSTTLRKPEEILPLLVDKTEKQIMKVIDALTTKRGKVNGRMNKDTILLRTL